jgi:hypothetical protein
MTDAAVRRVATSDVSAALKDVLSRSLGRDCRIIEIQRHPSRYWSSYTVELIDVWLDDGTTLPLFFKQLGRGALVEAAAGTKPRFLDDPLRELMTYRAILNPLHLGTPACYGAVINAATGRYWLFLERVSGSLLRQVGEFALWIEAARWLAGFHSKFVAPVEHWRQTVPLLVHDAAYYRRWLRRAQAFLGSSLQSTPEQRRWISWLAERYEVVVDNLMSLPRNVIHGEYYASNIIIQQECGRVRVCPVDWEMTAVGPGLVDLAALTGGNWTDAERTALCEAYLAALPPGAGWAPQPDALWTILGHCRLHLALQWLGWAPGWVPPPEHRYAWFSEAVVLAEWLSL